MPILKRDGSIRICGDYRSTVNQAATKDSYPLHGIEDLFTKLSGGRRFSKLDLSHAYQQIPLGAEAQDLVTVNTHLGMFRYTRLPFGVAAAPSIFKRTMDNMIQGLPHVTVYLDDILVTGETEKEHLENLEDVLKRLADAGFRLKREKCEFMVSSVKYLGHQINAAGFNLRRKRARPSQMPQHPEMQELRSYLGLLNYYGKFIANLASVLAPLHQLLRKDVRWKWGEAEEDAFQRSKKELLASPVLVHYDPRRELLLACDTSPYGVGAVLSQRMEDGTEHPVAFASRSLSPAEKGYSQLDREGLAIIFGVKRFTSTCTVVRLPFKRITSH